MQVSYAEFRRRLDDVLRQRDAAALRAFLVAEGQWQPDTTTDPERAMWMMIATSPALSALHDEAIHWLIAHGYTDEARALAGQAGEARGSRAGGQPGRSRKPQPRRPRGAPAPRSPRQRP